MLLDYFGEKTTDDCGCCDVCQNKKNATLSPSVFDQITSSLKDLLSNEPLKLNELVERLPYPQEQIIETVRYLVDERFLRQENQKYFLNSDKKR